MYRENFPTRIKQLRTETELSQRDVASETKIHASTIARYETGKLEPDLEKLGILADFYEVSLDWLIGTKGGRSKLDEKIKYIKYDKARVKKHRLSASLTASIRTNITATE